MAMAETGLEESQKLVPVKTGALKKSGRIVHRRGTDTAEVRYGGGSVGYASAVHQRADVKHPVGQWMFLRKPMHDRLAMRRAVAAAFKEILTFGTKG